MDFTYEFKKHCNTCANLKCNVEGQVMVSDCVRCIAKTTRRLQESTPFYHKPGTGSVVN